MARSCPDYVIQADQDIVVIDAPSIAKEQLLALGFSVRPGTTELHYRTHSNQQKAEVFSELRNLGFAFLRGREWSPAEVFEWLRDKGLLVGAFTEIYWTNPQSWHVAECR